MTLYAFNGLLADQQAMQPDPTGQGIKTMLLMAKKYLEKTG